MKSNLLSNQIKAVLLNYYTFERGAVLACTELYDYCHSIADVVILTKKGEVIEIEIKISKYDLNNELKKGRRDYFGHDKHKVLVSKHDVLSKSSGHHPNKFYFCVPSELVSHTVEFAEKLNKNYGVIEYTPNKPYSDSLRFVKKAFSLHSVNNGDLYRSRMMDRIGNDLCKFYRRMYLEEK